MPTFTAATSSGTNVIVDPSTGAGQFLIVGYMDDDSPTNPITMPAGFAQEANNYSAGDGGNAVLAFLQSSAGGGGNLTFGALSDACEVACAYTGVNATPFDVTPTVTNVASGATTTTTWTITAPSITTVTDNCVILIVVCFDPSSLNISVNSITAPGFTQRAIGNTGSLTSTSVAILEGAQTTHGAFGTTTVTANMNSSASGGWVVYTIALRPTASGGSISLSVAGIHYQTA